MTDHFHYIENFTFNQNYLARSVKCLRVCRKAVAHLRKVMVFGQNPHTKPIPFSKWLVLQATAVLLESAPGPRSSTLSKVHHCTLSLRVLHPKVRVLKTTPFVNKTKRTISCDKLSDVSICSYKSVYIKNTLSVWLRPHTTSLLYISTQ